VLITAAFGLACPDAVLAHDPGLSSLDIQVGRTRLVATLSLAAADWRALAGAGGGNLEAIALESIEIRLDGVRLPGTIESRTIDSDTGASVVLTFSSTAGDRLTIRSGIPGRLALGHRQLLTVRGANAAVLAERMLDARASECELDPRPGARRTDTVRQFLALGTRHILGGYDHLLFLGALLFGVRRLRDVVATVTAFTVAHSFTLGLAALGYVHVPGALVEPMIAASIVYVGIENLLREQIDSRWKLTFAFGLIHGFGFAGALQELGIAAGMDAAIPLGAFNLGVEAGQIAVAVLVWPLVRLLNARPALRVSVAPVCSLLVVAAGIYWLVQRTIVS